MNSKGFENGFRDGTMYAESNKPIPEMIMNLPPNDYRNGFKAGYVATKLTGKIDTRPVPKFLAWRTDRDDVERMIFRSQQTDIVLCERCVVNEQIVLFMLPDWKALVQDTFHRLYTWRYALDFMPCIWCGQ